VFSPTVVEFDEDSEARTTLQALRCTAPSWSIDGSSSADYLPTLEGNEVVHRFAPDRHGAAAATIRLSCEEGSVTALVSVVVRPQPDVTVTLHEVAGADHLLTPIRVIVNGAETVLPPTGGKVQFRQGLNQLQLVENAGWRSLQVWEVNGLVVPLHESGSSFGVTVANTDDAGTAVVRVLHATAHDWYRAGAASEADVRAMYWSDGSWGVLPGFVGFVLGERDLPVYTQLGPLTVDGVQVCSAVPESRYFDYQAAVDAWRSGYAAVPVRLGWEFAESLEDFTPFSAITDGQLTVANSWSLACDAPVAVVQEHFHAIASGHPRQLVIRIPSGSSQAQRIDALWRLPRKMGSRVTGSAWVSATTEPGPSDLRVAEHFFPLADAAARRGMAPLQF
jgi:hypothetical protein